MKSTQVINIDRDTICSEEYDISIFASGYESRSIFIPGLINPNNVTNSLIFGFKEDAHSGNRVRNDSFFNDRWKCEPISLSRDDEKPIYDQLYKLSNSLDNPIKILIDYSSMSRLWYSAVLNWSRFLPPEKEVNIDFVYALGNYDSEEKPMVIRGIVCIPGCEGRAYHLRESIAVFGLGFYGPATLAVLDQLEADKVYAFMAKEESVKNYGNRVFEKNTDLIHDHRICGLLELPLSNVEMCYRILADALAPHRSNGEITIIPMGPKPHVLASILVSMHFREIACLRVSGAPAAKDVKPTGEISATRIIIEDDQ